MTRSVEEITREEKIDLRVLVDYIKLDLFPKAKFVLGKNEWDVGGRIYNDYIKCCHGRIGLQTMNDADRESYMEKIWMKALTKNIQKKALVQKRSAIYTVMQNRFAGTLKNRGKVFEYWRLYLTYCYSWVQTDLCTLCVENTCVLPSIQSIGRRLEDPKAYFTQETGAMT
jgi:hypothetical protein